MEINSFLIFRYPMEITVIIAGIINMISCAVWFRQLEKRYIAMLPCQKKFIKSRTATINRHFFVLGAVIFVEALIIGKVTLCIVSGFPEQMPTVHRYLSFGVYMAVILFLVASSQCSSATVAKLMVIRGGDGVRVAKELQSCGQCPCPALKDKPKEETPKKKLQKWCI